MSEFVNPISSTISPPSQRMLTCPGPRLAVYAPPRLSTPCLIRCSDPSRTVQRLDKSQLTQSPFPILELMNEYLTEIQAGHVAPTLPRSRPVTPNLLRLPVPQTFTKPHRMDIPVLRSVTTRSTHSLKTRPVPHPTPAPRTALTSLATRCPDALRVIGRNVRPAIERWTSKSIAVDVIPLKSAGSTSATPTIVDQDTYVGSSENVSWYNIPDEHRRANSPTSSDRVTHDDFSLCDLSLNDSSSDDSPLDDCSLVVNLSLTKTTQHHSIPVRMPAHTKHGRIRQLKAVYRGGQKSVLPEHTGKKSSSFINRMKTQSEVKRTNQILVRKILKAKSTVCSFRR